MNYRGSYRHLLRNGIAAMVAAIEVYNKPRFTYRDECFVILLLNAWELILKAIISKNGKSIFYPKKRGQPYRTLSWRDALIKAEGFFPTDLPILPMRRNLELLATYRDNAVHFYNARGFSSVIYRLAQTSIVNFKDLLYCAFGVDLGNEISWNLLPLGIKPPLDPIEYIQHVSKGGKDEKHSGARAVRQFLAELISATKAIEEVGADTGRLLTVFKVKTESTKKIEYADIVVGVQRGDASEGPLTIIKTQDPNVTHPLRQRDIVQRITSLHGKPFTSFTFQAIVWKYNIKDVPHYCWRATEGVLIRYSHDLVAWIRRLSVSEVDSAVVEYKRFMREQMRRKRNGSHG